MSEGGVFFPPPFFLLKIVPGVGPEGFSVANRFFALDACFFDVGSTLLVSPRDLVSAASAAAFASIALRDEFLRKSLSILALGRPPMGTPLRDFLFSSFLVAPPIRMVAPRATAIKGRGTIMLGLTISQRFMEEFPPSIEKNSIVRWILIAPIKKTILS